MAKKKTIICPSCGFKNGAPGRCVSCGAKLDQLGPTSRSREEELELQPRGRSAQHATEVEVDVAHVHREQAAPAQVAQVEGDRLLGEQVHRDGAAAEGVDHQHVDFCPLGKQAGVGAVGPRQPEFVVEPGRPAVEGAWTPSAAHSDNG